MAHDFRVQSESSQNHLRKFIAEVNTKFSEVTSNDQQEDKEEQDELDELLGNIEEEISKAPQQKLVGSSVVAPKKKLIGTTNQPLKSPISPQRKVIAVKLQKPSASTSSLVWIKEELQSAKDETEPIPKEAIPDDNIVEDHQTDGDDSSQFNDPLIGEPIMFDAELPAYASDEEMQEEHLEIEHFDFEVNRVNSKCTPVKRPRRRKQKKSIAGAGDDVEDEAHICEVCNKDFSTRTNLLRHMNTHDGVKPYRCDVCGNCFTQNGSLKQHMHIHTGDRPYQCEFCDRGFTQAKSLVFHMRRHTGEKPFTCDECGMTFRQKDGLKRHQIVRHTSEPKSAWSCDTCGKVRLL